MYDSNFKIDKLHVDILREIGNIGSGNAITSLSKLLNKKVDMKVPNVKILESQHLSDLIGGPENIIIGILVNVHSEKVNGIIMFLIEHKYAKILINNLFDEYKSMINDNNDINGINDIEFSALKELGNILISSYLSSISEFMNIRLVPSVPSISIDMAGAILSVPAIEFSKISDKVLFIESVFVASDKNISGYFIFVPDFDSFEIMISSMFSI